MTKEGNVPISVVRSVTRSGGVTVSGVFHIVQYCMISRSLFVASRRCPPANRKCRHISSDYIMRGPCSVGTRDDRMTVSFARVSGTSLPWLVPSHNKESSSSAAARVFVPLHARAWRRASVRDFLFARLAHAPKRIRSVRSCRQLCIDA